MLRLLQAKEDALVRFCEKDVFGTRISAYYSTYGTEFAFALFYLQEIDQDVTAAISKIDGSVTLCCKENADFEELAEFLSVIGFESLMCSAETCGNLMLKPKKTGSVVEFKGSKKTSEKCSKILTSGFELTDIYDILKRSDFDGLSERLPWLSDVSYRMKMSTASAKVAEAEGKAVACAMVLFETGSAALIGAVATLPEFRGRGFAGELVTSLAAEMTPKNKRTELLCAEGSIIDFYNKIGFEKTGEWAIV